MDDLNDLISHLAHTSRLDRGEAARVVADVVAFFGETAETYVVRRHGELQGENLTNAAIFARISGELSRRRFAAPSFSERQIRRIIYG